MNADFHYYATYCAAVLAGYSHEESLEICYSDQMVDLCTRTLLDTLHAPLSAATTQLQLELMDARTDIIGLQDITRIWSSFHFLPYDLHAEPPHRASKGYKNKYRLICKPNGELLEPTVTLAKNKGTQAIGIAMHPWSSTIPTATSMSCSMMKPVRVKSSSTSDTVPLPPTIWRTASIRTASIPRRKIRS